MGGARVTPKTKMLIIHMMEQMIQNEIKPTGERILSACEDYIRKNKIKDIFLPSLRTVQNITSEAQKQKSDLDNPWTLAESISRGFPADSTPALLKAWKHCLALEQSFTTRAAKWASYLCTVITETSTLVLFATQYATRERVHELIDEDFNTTDIDALLVMDIEEYGTMFLLGKLLPMPILGGGILVNASPLSMLEDAYHTAKEAEDHALITIELVSDTYDNVLRTSNYKCDALMPIQELDIPEHIVWIYIYWLTWLTKGPKWDQMDKSQIIKIIEQLREWVAKLPKIHSEIAGSIIEIEKTRKSGIKDLFLHDELMPIELLMQAGYFSTDLVNNMPGSWPSLANRIHGLKNKAKKIRTIKKKNPDLKISIGKEE